MSKIDAMGFEAHLTLMENVNKAYLILDALLGPSLRGMVLSVSPGISASPFLTMVHERTESCPSTIHPRTDFRFLSPVFLGL